MNGPYIAIRLLLLGMNIDYFLLTRLFMLQFLNSLFTTNMALTTYLQNIIQNWTRFLLVVSQVTELISRDVIFGKINLFFMDHERNIQTDRITVAILRYALSYVAW